MVQGWDLVDYFEGATTQARRLEKAAKVAQRQSAIWTSG